MWGHLEALRVRRNVSDFCHDLIDVWNCCEYFNLKLGFHLLDCLISVILLLVLSWKTFSNHQVFTALCTSAIPSPDYCNNIFLFELRQLALIH